MDSAKKERFVREMKLPVRENIVSEITEALARPLAEINDVLIEAAVDIVSKGGNPNFLVRKNKNGDVLIELTAHR